MDTAPERTCPICGTPVRPPRTFCRLSCRIEQDRRQVRTPRLFPRELTLESELPADEDDLRYTHATRERIGRLYGGRR